MSKIAILTASVQVVRIDGDTQESKQTVVCRNDFIIEFRARNTVNIEAQRGTFAASNMDVTDIQGHIMRIVNHQFVRCGTERSENRVEKQRIGRKLQFKTAVGADDLFLSARDNEQKEEHDSYEGDISFHVMNLKLQRYKLLSDTHSNAKYCIFAIKFETI